MEPTKEMEEKIGRLQIMEQSLQNILIQKQTLQNQIIEIDSALEELKRTDGNTYKLIGPIMVLSKKKELEDELTSKKEVISLRIKSIEKQEKNIKDKITEIQSVIMQELKKDEKRQ